ncbi:MAG: hypothetical protein RR977_04035, partial [Oscillospiraceae bacterium]
FSGTASAFLVLQIAKNKTFFSDTSATIFKIALLLILYFLLLLVTRSVSIREIRDFCRILHSPTQSGVSTHLHK